MSWLKRFWNQPSVRYRNFQVVFTILTLNFAIPTLFYVFAPAIAHGQFVDTNLLLGGADYAFPEFESRFWRYLGAANVATLAFSCALLQLDLRRNFAVLAPLTFMKALAATLWLAGFIEAPEHPVFLGAALLDYASSAAFVWFATRARRDIDNLDDADLVPRPVERGPWFAFERRWAETAMRAVLPNARIDTGFWQRLGRPGAERMRLGLRAAVWALTLAPVGLGFGHTLPELGQPEQERFVARLASSSSWYVRQLVEVVKTFACFAHYAPAAAR